MAAVQHATPGTYAATVKELTSRASASASRRPAAVFVASWCPDCTRALPAVLAGASAASVPLVVVDVGPREAWRSPHNALRGGDLKLTCVPSLVAFDVAGAVDGVLGGELEAAPTEAAARSLVDAFLRPAGGPDA